jgi:predicted ester cyclase
MAVGIGRCRTLVASVLAVVVLWGAYGVTAQTPEPMSAERTVEVMEAYIAALTSNGAFADYFDDDIVGMFMDIGQEVVGKDAAEAAIVDFHTVAFDATIEVQTFTAVPGIAYAEVVFSGPHTGEFAGIPATGREVSVPYVVVAELSNDLITTLRLYGPTTGIIQQLTAPVATPAP